MLRPPLVSIVTPSFNQGRFLRHTIESVLQQSYPYVEYVVIDGGSTDDSVTILQSYRDRFRWCSEPDGGQADALNKGFAQTSGDILAYLNSDDVLLPGALDKVAAYFTAHPHWQLLYGRAQYIDEHDRHLGMYRTAPFSLQHLADDSCICQPATFWQRELTERLGAFDERLHFCMDYDYWLRAANCGAHIEHVDDVLACSRWYAETKTMSCRAAMDGESRRVRQHHTSGINSRRLKCTESQQRS